MTYDARKHAELLTDYCVRAQPGDRVLVAATTLALPVVRELHRTLLERGAQPVVRLTYPEQLDDFYQLAPDGQIDTLDPMQEAEARSFDASIRVNTPQAPDLNTDPARMARHRKTLAPIAMSRLHPRWCLTLFPTSYGAESAGMAEEQYADFVGSAMFLGDPDPVARWGEIREFQARLIERLSRADQVHIQADGTDLRLSVKGRVWANSDGRRNMPSGEVFVSPHETSAEGHIHYDLPAVYGGRVVQGIRLTFREGEVVEATAEQGEDVLREALRTDEGARFLGEIGIGTNYGIQVPSRNILFDEKIGGTVHLAVGKSYPETGGTNESAVHWDMISDLRTGGRILLDGEVFQEDGQFVG